MRSFGRATVRLLVTGALAAVAVSLSSAYGRIGGTVSPRVQAALDLAFKTALPDVTAKHAPPPNLDDGRSKVSTRWRQSVEEFAIADRDHAHAPGGIVFVGSSSISLWGNLETQFKAKNIVRRGLGGARMSDCAHYVDRLILPYKPKLVVVYAGDNDLAEKAEPELVLAAYVDLVKQVHRALPETRIAFVSIKPSPLRAALMPVISRTNDLVAAYSAGDARLDYIDIYSKMLDADGHVRPELYQADALHPNAVGYAVWRKEIAAHLP